MKAALFKEKNLPLRFEEVATPIPSKGQVLVKLFHHGRCFGNNFPSSAPPWVMPLPEWKQAASLGRSF